MTLFVLVTDKCTADADTHGLASEVDRFRDRVETSQATSLFDPFPPPYLVKKKLGGRQGRLIAELRQAGDHAVIVFLAILIRGSRAYEDEFARDPHEYGRHHFSGLVPDEMVQRYVAERTRVAPLPPKQKPTEAEDSFLYGAFAHHNNSGTDDLVCETALWVEGVSQERVSKQLALFRDPCLAALTKESGLHFIPIASKAGWGIWALRSEGRLVLITPVTDATASQGERQAKEIEQRLKDKGSLEVLRASRRAYPALIFADDELWIDLEKEPVANMALSPEESEVLESTRTAQQPFPLFINGRAGSGKSTILQYLFADLLFYYLRTPELRGTAPPLYLTANGELLRVAKAFVERLLKSEATFAQEDGARLVEENRALLDDAFREFQPHLLSLVPPELRAKRFAASGRVDYPRFRKMWQERFERDPRALADFGPDLSWHIIRSYIKGMSSEEFLEPSDYAQLPDNQLTVTGEAYRLVFDKVWTGWYARELEDKGLWDDQDLTRYVLDNDLPKRIYPAIFCDEAQDFTRIELELLLRLNLFSERSLPPNQICRVPFAFAGDQFQTLNPTGFRWDSIKASFVEKFIFELDPARRSGRTDLNYCELEYNYRSTQKIVRFSNLVQAMRAALFRLPDIKPQYPWAEGLPSFPVSWFRANDAAFWKAFGEHAGFVVIIPCNEGEEREFVEKDSVLKEHIRIDDGVPVNVLSAGRAKGREYPAVLVYGFGAHSDTNITKQLFDVADSDSGQSDKSLPLQYFINRLYVAVSRPKTRLVIVDSDEGFKRLWECARDDGLESQLHARIRRGSEVWSSQTEGMTAGETEDITRDTAVDPLENAQAFEQDGLARRDPFLLRQAAQAYRSGNNIPRARECRARSLEFEGRWYEAAEAFFEAGFAADGLRCHWRAGKKGWARLLERFGQNPQLQSEFEFQWARAAVQTTLPDHVVELVKSLANRLEQQPKFAESCVGDPIWRDALEAALAPHFDAGRTRATPEQLQRLVPGLEALRERGVVLPSRIAAHLFYLGERYREAVALWEESGETKHPDYLRAKGLIEPYPARVISLQRANLWSEIVASFDAATDTALNAEQASAVVAALVAKERLQDAYDLSWKIGSSGPMLHVASSAFGRGNQELAGKALHASMILLVREANWEPIAAFAKSRVFAPDATWSGDRIKAWVVSQSDALENLLVRSLARSPDLTGAPAHVQKVLAESLSRIFQKKNFFETGDVTILEAGAAIERTERFTEGLAYYEGLVKRKLSPEEQRFAQERWLMVKRRHLEHEKSHRSKRASAVLQELERAKEASHIKNLDRIAEYADAGDLDWPKQPALAAPETTASPNAQLPDQVSMRLGLFEIVFSRAKGRCNITHTETMETAWVKVADRQFGGEVAFQSGVDGEWLCAPWDLAVVFPKVKSDPITLSMKKLGLHIRLELH